MKMQRAFRLFALGCLFASSLPLHAVEPYQEYRKRVESSQSITALTDALMGESVSLYNGTTEFTATDIDLAGNNALPVRLTRRFSIKIEPSGTTSYNPDLGGAGSWDVDVPYISAMFDSQYGWGSNLAPTQRCSLLTAPQVNGAFDSVDIWQGYSIHVPGGDRTMLLKESRTPQPNDGLAHRWTTRERDAFTCIPMQRGMAGEGFSMLTTSGLRYDFDIAVSRAGGVMNYYSNIGTARVVRTKIFLLASKVSDRFGNTVKFNYNASGNPTSIVSSDGRSIALTYASGLLVSATADGHAWSYTYGVAAEAGLLETVQRPDKSTWKYAYEGTLAPGYVAWDGGSNSTCNLKAPPIPNEFTLTVTHPSGAVGAFDFSNSRHFRSGIHMSECLLHSAQHPDEPTTWSLHTPNYFDVMTLDRKSLSGPGIPKPLVWTYDYQRVNPGLWGSNAQPAVYPCASCPAEKLVTVTNPDLSQRRYRYGILYASNEGRLLGTTVVDAAGTAKRIEATTYLGEPEAAAQNFQPRYGLIINGDDPSTAAVRPVTSQTTQQDGVTFSMQVDRACANSAGYCFDEYGNPTQVTRSSTLGYSKTEGTKYFDQTKRWILGQIGSVTCLAPASCAGQVESMTDYDDTTALALNTYIFGKLQQTLTYNLTAGSDQAGTLATVADGNNNVTTLSGWKRGIPQTIHFPTTPESPAGAARSAVVNTDGTIASITDENGYTSNYTYDEMGRMATVAYPAGDSTVWNITSQAFGSVNVAEYGIAAGHWKQVISTGNGRKETYFDALWRPLVTREYDTSAMGSQRFTRNAYDDAGHLAFASYPGAVDTLSTGTWTSFDALDRVIGVSQDSELGLLTTSTSYLQGFKTQVTTPRKKVTTTTYMAYDQPTTDWPIAVAHPASAFTDIVRDAYGKPQSMTRRDATGSLSATRSYVYDGNQQLCARIEPETGTTVMAYDSANNVLWSAAGLANSVGCNRADASIPARRVMRTYDGRNRVTSLRFPDGLGDQDWTYTPDGLPAQVTAYSGTNQTIPVTTAYHYNKRRMLDGQGENVSQPGWYSWGIGYGYDGNGHLSVQTYPDGSAVTFAPNALGQPTQAGTYVSAASYYPNGAIRQFKYGNGIVHTMTQNGRQLPTRCTDGTAFDFGYSFDADGNVGSITDYAQAGRQTRTMTYDDLGRLSTTSSPMFNGTVATYRYNELDDLTSVKAPASTAAPARNQTYWYEPATRHLTNVADADTGASVIGIGYDPQGNVYNKNGRLWEFDFGNRLRMVHDGSSVVEAYRYDGLGRRVLEWNAGGNIVSQYANGGQLLYQSNARTNQALAFVYLGGSLVAISSKPLTGGAATVKYQHTDALGTPVAVTSANQTVVERSEYDSFGGLLNRAITDGPGFTGHVQDAATGMTYMQQRYYDPSIGRFLSVDPVGTDSRAGANFNRYLYAADNPYRFFDPDGRCTGSHIENADGTCASTGGNTTLSIGPISGRSSAPEVNFAVKNGVRLSPALESQVSNLADSYQNRTGKKLVVTDGLRSPREQASRMLYKITHGEGISRYRNRLAANAVMNAYLSSLQDGSNPLDSMARIISTQMAKGTYISDHLLNDAADFRSTGVSRSAFREAAEVAGASKVLDEDVPSHLHVEY